MVCYDGALKPILFNRMKEAADTSDLVIVLGTRYFRYEDTYRISLTFLA